MGGVSIVGGVFDADANEPGIKPRSFLAKTVESIGVGRRLLVRLEVGLVGKVEVLFRQTLSGL